MRISIICPCCGFRPEYSRELALEILTIVAKYFNVPVDRALNKWTKDEPLGKVRGFTLYFIRSMTGEQFKQIGEIFNMGPVPAGSMVKRIELRLETVKAGRKELENLTDRIVGSLPAKLLIPKQRQYEFEK